MPPRDARERIEDILLAVEKALRYVEGMSFERFCADEKTIDAVARNIVVIGEAARHVPDEYASHCADIPWQDVRDMRNVVVHAYFRIDLEMLWKTLCDDLPALRAALKKVAEAG